MSKVEEERQCHKTHIDFSRALRQCKVIRVRNVAIGVASSWLIPNGHVRAFNLKLEEHRLEPAVSPSSGALRQVDSPARLQELPRLWPLPPPLM